ncbi:MAG: recombinase family protein [Oscillospiraceae bacterium]|nr:recombinase family protein [Oscillospiraceae bacterium]
MDIYDIRQLMRTKSIYDIPLRVTFYARVSTDKDEQLNSLENQISYYPDFIASHPKWMFLSGYVDEGLSGITTAKRENFHNMVRDAEAGMFDLIITKEITRFARNTLDSIQYTRRLLSCGVGVFFQNDNINTFDEDSELRLTIMSGIAQDELRRLSSRVSFGHQQAIKNGVVLGNGRMFGYDKDNKRLVINEAEAKMVRELFELYATNEYSMKQIEDIFWARGYRNHNGKKISHSTMSNTISNPKYKGYYVGNKVKIVDMFTKKQKFLPPEEWVMFKDETGEIVPAIVDEELWERANEVLRRRSKDVKRRQNLVNHPNLLTGRLVCTHCGCTYYRRDNKDRLGNINSRWVCSGKINGGKNACPSFGIYENEMKPILFEVFNETSDVVGAQIITIYMELLQQLEGENSLQDDINRAKARIDTERKKQGKLLEHNVSGAISDKDFKRLNIECAKAIEQAEKEFFELEKEFDAKQEHKERLDHIRKVLEQARKDAAKGIINKEFVETYIDKIYATCIESDATDLHSLQMRLEIRIFTGKTTEKYLQKFKGRTGHTSKKMIQAYENNL